MWPMQTAVIQEHERAFLRRDGRILRVLGPGRYRFFDPSRRTTIEAHAVVDTEADTKLAKVIENDRPDLAAQLFEVVQTGEGEVAIVAFDGVPTHLVGPWSKRYFWKPVTEVTAEYIDTREEPRISRRHLNALNTSGNKWVHEALVVENHAGLLYIDGKYAETLSPGRHAFWSVHRAITVTNIDLRSTTHEITAQEILTKDRVSLRATLTAFTEVVDPVKIAAASADWTVDVYRLVQFAAREAIAGRRLDDVLGDRDRIDAQIRVYVDENLGDIGIKITRLGVKDLILPGEMRTLLNKVVEAEKVAQANLIRRQEETAATRSLLNTARLMDNNPLLMRLKEIEALEKLTEKVGRIELVTGERAPGFDGLLRNLLKIDDKSGSTETSE